MGSYSNSSYSAPVEDDDEGFSHGLDEENSLQADIERPESDAARVVGRRNPDLPTENPVVGRRI